MRRWILAVVYLFTSAAIAAPLDSSFTWQGQLREGGSAANGLYDFRFCLYDHPDAGTQLACTTDHADVPVERGLFSVALDFGPATFAGQQRWLDIGVRAGASTGGYTGLLPRQLLRPAPEALHSLSATAVPWAGISGVPTTLADGTDNVGITELVAGAGLSGGTITGTGTIAVAPGGIVGAMVADAAIGAAQIAPAAVDAPALSPAAVTTVALADASVTRAKLSSDAVGAGEVDPATVQLRVFGTCASGEYLRGINEDGSVICDAVPRTSTRVLERLAPAGTHFMNRFVSLGLLADGRPVVAYYDNVNKDLRLYVCGNTACTSGESRLLDDTGDQGSWLALVVRHDGTPGIAYYDALAGKLKFYDCANAECTNGTPRVLDSTFHVGAQIAMALRPDGSPVIAYQNATQSKLNIYLCTNPQCSMGEDPRRMAAAGNYYGVGNAVAVPSDGYPVYVALDSTFGDLYFRRCGDPTCANLVGSSVFIEFDMLRGATYTSTSMVLRADGRPLIAYWKTDTATTSNLLTKDVPALRDCANPQCTATTLRYLKGATPTSGEWIQLALQSDGRPVIAYYDFGDTTGSVTALKYYLCADAACTDGQLRTLDDLGNVGLHASLKLRPDGRPVIAYWDYGNGTLKLHQCANAECQ